MIAPAFFISGPGELVLFSGKLRRSGTQGISQSSPTAGVQSSNAATPETCLVLEQALERNRARDLCVQPQKPTFQIPIACRAATPGLDSVAETVGGRMMNRRMREFTSCRLQPFFKLKSVLGVTCLALAAIPLLGAWKGEFRFGGSQF